MAALRADQHRRWRRGEHVPVEAYLRRVTALGDDAEALLDLIYSEVLLREEAGERPHAAEYVRRFPALEGSLRLQFELHGAVAPGQSAGATAAGPDSDEPSGGTVALTDGKAFRGRTASRRTGGPSAARDGDAPRDVPGYEVLSELGRGGMGVVYKARHVALDRVVALKMILAGGHAGRADLARFEAEAAALARLQHPNIVQIFEVGEHRGRPYFAQEFLQGGSLAARLNGTPWAPADAARLVETLARAVHAAHLQHIVHRDLKPANVLLTADGAPKIGDLGLAKRLDSDDGLSATGQVLGTPSYMPPEQAAGKGRDIGPEADVYSLGAILYELLTGRPPFKGPTSLETLHQVLDDEPVAPRGLQPKTPRDVETVCLKCLQKDPKRRYTSAEELAEDLRRFRAGEPVRARPVGAAERTWKWARSHATLTLTLSGAAAVVVLSVVIAFLMIADSRDAAIKSRNDAFALAADKAKLAETNAGLAAKESQARKDAQDAQHRAEDEADKANEVTHFLAGTFKASDPLGIDCEDFYIPKQWGEKLTAQELLERGEKKCRTDLRDRPAVQAKVLDTIGAVYLAQAKFKDAGRVLEEAHALLEGETDASPLDVAANLHNRGRLAHYLGQYDKAEPLYRKALEIRRQRLGPHDPLVSDTMLNLAWLLSEADEPEEAEKTFREVIALRRQEPGGDGRRDVAIAKFGLTAFFVDQGDSRNWPEAAQLAGEAMTTFLALEGDKNVGKAVGLFQTALIVRPVSPATAEAKLRECLGLTRQAIGDHNVYFALVLHELAVTLVDEGKDEEAESDFAQCVDIMRDLVGLEHPKAIVVISNYASVLARRGKRAEAEKLYDELLAAQEARFGEDHFFVANVLTAYADFLTGRDEARCERMLRRAVGIFDHSGGARRRYYATALANLGDLCLRQGRNAEAEKFYRDALPAARARHGEASEEAAYVEEGLGAARLRQGDTGTEVEKLLLAAADVYEQSPGKKPSDLMQTLDDLGAYYRAVGRPADAAAAARKRRQYRPDDPDQLFAAAGDLALCVPLVGRGKTQPTPEEQAEQMRYADEAMATLRQAVDKGFGDVKRVREANALAPLRGRADYADLLKRLER
jgi:tetratricopeptide (TPR) repeat protein